MTRRAALLALAERGIKWEKDVLSYDPFSGDKEGIERWLHNKIVTARKGSPCRECLEEIAPGTRIRSMRFVDGGEIHGGRVCQDCCDAAALSWTDDGRALQARFKLFRRNAAVLRALAQEEAE